MHYNLQIVIFILTYLMISLTRKHARGGPTDPDESYKFTNQNIT